MGIAATNRGTANITRQIDAVLAAKRPAMDEAHTIANLQEQNARLHAELTQARADLAAVTANRDRLRVYRAVEQADATARAEADHIKYMDLFRALHTERKEARRVWRMVRTLPLDLVQAAWLAIDAD